MKKFLFVFLAFLIMLSAFTPYSANAENKYLRVINKQTPLYLKQDLESVICYLPYTYYVELITELDNCYHVSVLSKDAPSIDGFVEKDNLFFDNLAVNTPYPDLTLSTIEHASLYFEPNCLKVNAFIFANRSLSLYGFLQDEQGAFLYFVSYGDKLGYIKEEQLSPFTIENHKNPLTFIKQEDKTPIIESTGKTNLEGSFTFRILVIVCLIFAGIIAIFIVIKPKKRQDKNSYYSENEYE